MALMTDAPVADSGADLRERLVKMREELIASLAALPHLDAGYVEPTRYRSERDPRG
jgi:hypothetical protein